MNINLMVSSKKETSGAASLKLSVKELLADESSSFDAAHWRNIALHHKLCVTRSFHMLPAHHSI